MTQPTFIDTAQVAILLGLPGPDAFLRRRIQLEDDHGFPLPLPHWRRPLKYRRDQVEHWLKGQGTPRNTETPIDPALISAGKVALLAEARRA